MAQGYSIIGHDTYLQWRTNTLGLAFDVDPSFGAGCQCWDYVSEFYYSAGWGAGYPLTGSNHYASECWTVNRSTNAGNDFDLIYNLSDVQTGDIIVLDGTTQNPPGHIAFADEDYDGSGYIWCLGQNQGGTPLPQGGTPVTRNRLGTSNFLGAFRYKDWHTTPPTPTGGETSKFPWVLYARKFRNKRNMV